MIFLLFSTALIILLHTTDVYKFSKDKIITEFTQLTLCKGLHRWFLIRSLDDSQQIFLVIVRQSLV